MTESLFLYIKGFNWLFYYLLIGDCTLSCLTCHSIACVVMPCVILMSLWFERVMLYLAMRMKWKSISCSSKRPAPLHPSLSVTL